MGKYMKGKNKSGNYFASFFEVFGESVDAILEWNPKLFESREFGTSFLDSKNKSFLIPKYETKEEPFDTFQLGKVW